MMCSCQPTMHHLSLLSFSGKNINHGEGERMQRGRCDGQFIIGDGTLVISPKKWSRPFSHFRRECMLARAVMDRFIYFLLCWREIENVMGSKCEHWSTSCFPVNLLKIEQEHIHRDTMTILLLHLLVLWLYLSSNPPRSEALNCPGSEMRCAIPGKFG